MFVCLVACFLFGLFWLMFVRLLVCLSFWFVICVFGCLFVWLVGWMVGWFVWDVCAVCVFGCLFVCLFVVLVVCNGCFVLVSVVVVSMCLLVSFVL